MEYEETLNTINDSLNLGEAEVAAGDELDALMAADVQQAAKATTPSPKKRRERRTLDDQEWLAEVGEDLPTEPAVKRRRKAPARKVVVDEEEEEEEEEEEVFTSSTMRILGQVLKHRVCNGQLQLYVKWKTYPHKFNCWVPYVELLSLAENVAPTAEYLAGVL
jgi:ornithine cyclodeaminase/alanine dehydrogenase-like protein (mu-crystallin family)